MKEICLLISVFLFLCLGCETPTESESEHRVNATITTTDKVINFNCVFPQLIKVVKLDNGNYKIWLNINVENGTNINKIETIFNYSKNVSSADFHNVENSFLDKGDIKANFSGTNYPSDCLLTFWSQRPTNIPLANGSGTIVEITLETKEKEIYIWFTDGLIYTIDENYHVSKTQSDWIGGTVTIKD